MPDLVTVVVPPHVIRGDLFAGQGPAGRPGTDGRDGINGTDLASSAVFAAPFAMGGGRVVLFIGGALAYADPINAAHAGRVLGLTTQAAAQGDPITVRGTGELLDASFAFAADAPVYVGASGVPTATPPAAAFIQRVGTCIEPGRIRIALAPAILT